MELTYSCPSCAAVGHLDHVEKADEVVCRHCGATRPLHSGAIDQSGLLACPYCATTDLYIQKDFPQGLGLFIVVVGFAISTIFWYYVMPIYAYAVLLASALVDMALYYKVRDVTICYRCLCQFRGARANPEERFRHFDLAIGERYRQERIRAQELRDRKLPAEGASAERYGKASA
jgi:hypothetical protein